MDNMGITIKTTVGFKSVLIAFIIVGAAEIFYLNRIFDKTASPKLYKVRLNLTSTVNSRNMSVQNRSLGFNKTMLHHVQTCFNLQKCKKSGNVSSCPHKPNSEGMFECNHFMTFPQHPGRTGNQLFQIATLIGTAMYHGYTPLIDPSFSLNDIFDLPNVVHFELNNKRTFRLNTFGFHFDDMIFNLSRDYNWTLNGYLHSWKYFKGANMAIKKALAFKQNLMAKASDFMKLAVSQTAIKVCVHVRRGDYLSERRKKEGRVVAPVRYIKEAMTRFKQNFTRVHFVILSDDKKWCKENMNWENVTLSPFDSPGLDMALMSLCDHTIMTAGTFGWWGAWLAGGDVIYWTGYPRNGSLQDRKINKNDLFPGEWIGLP